MRRHNLMVLVVLTVGLLVASPRDLHAQPPVGVTLSYDLFVQGNSSPVSGSLGYTPGQDLTVQIFLKQTGGSSGYLASEGGLFQGGVRLTYGSPTGTQGVINVPNVNNIALNTTTAVPPGTSAFNDVVTSNASRSVNTDFAQFSPSTDGTYGVLPDANGRILLGTVTFTTNSSGGTTNLVLADIPPSTFADNLTINATVLDSAITPVTIAVSPVPEPSVILAIGTIAMLVIGQSLMCIKDFMRGRLVDYSSSATTIA